MFYNACAEQSQTLAYKSLNILLRLMITLITNISHPNPLTPTQKITSLTRIQCQPEQSFASRKEVSSPVS